MLKLMRELRQVFVTGDLADAATAEEDRMPPVGQDRHMGRSLGLGGLSTEK